MLKHEVQVHNTTSVTEMILPNRQLLKCVFSVSAILIHDTLLMTSLFTDTLISEALW